MMKIAILCTFMILVEAYHVVFHNKIFYVCRPFYNRLRFDSRYQKMSMSFWKFYIYADVHKNDEVLKDFMKTYDYQFKVLYNIFCDLPTSVKIPQMIIARTDKKVIRTAFITTFIEILYVGAIIWLLILLPNSIAFRLGILIFVLSCIHAFNERKDKMVMKWFPFVDATICIVSYTLVLLAFGLGAF